MDASTRAPGYDLFKLIVAIVLLLLALVLMWISSTQTPGGLPPTQTAPATVLAASPTALPISPTSSSILTDTPAPIPVPTETEILEPTATPAPALTATETSALTPTPPPPPAPTATETSALTPTPLPPPAATPTPKPTATPIAEIPPGDVCTAATSRSRLQVGAQATIIRRLNFRSSPGIRENWLKTNLPGTPVEIVAGPECVPYWTGAYLWWQIRLPDGQVGWSAEGSLHGSFFFIEPE